MYKNLVVKNTKTDEQLSNTYNSKIYKENSNDHFTSPSCNKKSFKDISKITDNLYLNHTQSFANQTTKSKLNKTDSCINIKLNKSDYINIEKMKYTIKNNFINKPFSKHFYHLKNDEDLNKIIKEQKFKLRNEKNKHNLFLENKEKKYLIKQNNKKI